MEKRSKLYNVSLLRMFSTILIVVFHILLCLSPGQGKDIFPLYIGVPIFLFISGFLYANKEIKSIKNFYKASISKILLPTIVFVLIYFIILGIISLATNVSFFGLTYDVSGNGTPLNSIGHLWFIPAIIGCYLILPLLNKMYNKSLKSWQLLLCLLLFVVMEIGFNILCTFVVLPFAVGFFTQKLKQKHPEKRLLAIILAIVAFCGLAAAYPFVFKITSNNSLVSYLLHALKELFVTFMGGDFQSRLCLHLRE